MTDRLYRSRDERMFAGVAGGVAERFDLDPSLVRVVWIILMFLSGSLSFWLYVVMAIVVPEAPTGADRWAGWTTAYEHPSGAVAGWGSTPAAGTAAAGTSAFASTDPPSGTEKQPDGGSTAGAGSIPDVAPPGEPPAAVDPGSGAPPTQPPPTEALDSGRPPPPPPPSASDAPPAWSPTVREQRRRGGGGPVIAGIVLILLGGYFLLRTVAPEINLGAFWPVVLIVIGIALLFGSIRTDRGQGG